MRSWKPYETLPVIWLLCLFAVVCVLGAGLSLWIIVNGLRTGHPFGQRDDL